MNSNQLQNLKKFMLDNSLTHTDEWLAACVQWVHQDHDAAVTDAVLKQQVQTQWLDANLEEMESCCLPADLANQRCCSLTGRYGLQMNSIRDIGSSAYSQWNQIKKLENENTNVAAKEVDNSWAPKPKGCLYLTLSDGTQKVYGLEQSPINSISVKLKPGVKILVTGPVECRRGILQLRPSNVKVLGGEVESFAEANSVESILADILHAPRDSGSLRSSARPTSTTAAIDLPTLEGTFPSMDDDDLLFMEIDENIMQGTVPSSSSNTNSSAMDTQAFANAETQRIDLDDLEVPSSRNIYAPSANSSNISNVTAPQIPKIVPPKPNHSTFRKPPPVKTTTTTFAPTVSRVPTTTPTKLGFKTAKASTNTNPKSKQLKIDGYMKPMPVIIKPPTPVRIPSTSSEESVPTQVDEEDSIILTSDDDDDGALMEIIENSFAAELQQLEDAERARLASTNTITDSRQGNPSAQAPPQLSSKTSNPAKSTGIVLPIVNSPTKLPIIVPKQPYIYLKQVNENCQRFVEIGELVYVKACIATVVSNIQVLSHKWALTVSINDGTGFLVCKISPNILNDIMGFDPVEMKRLRSSKTQGDKEKIAQGMKTLATTLVHLNAIFGIKLQPEPEIIYFSDILPHHLSAVKQRTSFLH